MESEVIADLRARAALSTKNLPSVCCYTFLNTHQSYVALWFMNGSYRGAA